MSKTVLFNTGSFRAIGWCMSPPSVHWCHCHFKSSVTGVFDFSGQGLFLDTA